MENLFAENFPGLFTIATYGDYMLAEIVVLYHRVLLRHRASWVCNAHVLGTTRVWRVLCLQAWLACWNIFLSVYLNCSISLVITFGDEDGIDATSFTSGLLVHRMIPSNIVSLFRVFTLVVVAAIALPLFGTIGEFQPLTKTSTVYSERLDQFFVANNIGSHPTSASEAVIAAAEKQKVAIMISLIGKKTYSVLCDLCSLVNPKDKTFEQQHF